jgi:hypothetical protein
MSTRQLRKIRQRQELLKVAESEKVDASTSEEEREDVSPVAKPRVSLFAALGSDEDDEDEDQRSEVNWATQDAEAREPPESTSVPTTTAKKAKKKKKKGKKKQTALAEANAAAAAEKPTEDEDEIDRALKELNIQPRATPGGPAKRAGISEYDTVLHVDAHNLKDIHELRQLFGRDAIDVVQQSDRDEERAARRRHGQHGAPVDLETFLKGDPLKKLPEITLRKNIFVEGKDYWPRATSGGLSMEEVRKDPDGQWVEYRYVHNEEYDKTQAEFFDRVTTGNPMTLVYFLKQHREPPI